MIVFTDDPENTERIMPAEFGWEQEDGFFLKDFPAVGKLATRLFGNSLFYRTQLPPLLDWRFGFFKSQAQISQYDAIIESDRNKEGLQDGIFCLAGSSSFCHGQRGRSWEALAGNIHLTAHFVPDQKIGNFNVGFSILAAVSVIETIDSIEGLKNKAQIKWVNDIFIQDAKIAGFLAHTQSCDRIIETATIGIGLNVEKTPRIETDVFVPAITSLYEVFPNRILCSPQIVLRMLLTRLARNYDHLKAGRYLKLLNIYRERSMVIGRKVIVLSDSTADHPQEIASGIVSKIGDNLELFFLGQKDPVTRGRLILKK